MALVSESPPIRVLGHFFCHLFLFGAYFIIVYPSEAADFFFKKILLTKLNKVSKRSIKETFTPFEDLLLFLHSVKGWRLWSLFQWPTPLYFTFSIVDLKLLIEILIYTITFIRYTCFDIKENKNISWNIEITCS